jgi:hypothetical protein
MLHCDQCRSDDSAPQRVATTHLFDHQVAGAFTSWSGNRLVHSRIEWDTGCLDSLKSIDGERIHKHPMSVAHPGEELLFSIGLWLVRHRSIETVEGW